MNSKSPFYSVLLFMVWPFLALISAFRNYKNAWAKNILWGFIAFYGFAFAIGTESAGTDIIVYINEFQTLHWESFNISRTIEYFSESGEIDILRTLIAVLLSRFTDNPAVLTLVYGIIFGFFYSRNIWFILERAEGEIKPITILLLTCCLFVIPIWQINGFRFWTAAHVFIYGLLPFLYDGKRGGLIISSIAILVHFSFIVPISVLFFYLFLGNRLVIYFSFFIATFFISEIDLAIFNELVESYAPDIIQERTSSYRGEDYVETYREESNDNKVWYAVWYGRVLKWAVMSYMVLLFVKGHRYFEENENWLRLFSFTLLFYGVSNLLSSLPSGGRFLAVVNLCALVLITLYIQKRAQDQFFKRFIAISTPALLLYIIVSLRIGLLSISATTVLGNPIIALLFMNQNIPLNDFLRMIL